MQSEYPVMQNDKRVGTALVTRQGMYCRIHCRIGSWVLQPCGVIMRSLKGEKDLGLCFREGNGFALYTRLPIKSLGEKNLTFETYRKLTELDGIFLPVDKDTAFSHLLHLKNARFAVVNSKTGVYIPGVTEKSQVPQDSGQNP